LNSHPFVLCAGCLRYGGYRKGYWTMSDAYIGEIRLLGGNYAPENWRICDGSLLNINEYEGLFALIGTTYGGDGVKTFRLPDLRGRVPVGQGQGPNLTARVLGQAGGSSTVTLTQGQMPAHSHSFSASTATATTATMASGAGFATPVSTGADGPVVAYAPSALVTDAEKVNLSGSAITAAGGSQPHNNLMPYQAINYIIAVKGLFPGVPPERVECDPMIGEIRLFSFGFVPSRRWQPCEGGELLIAQYEPLYAVIRNFYGGDGKTYFNVPDLRSRVAVGFGDNPKDPFDPTIGSHGGMEQFALLESQTPTHSHHLVGASIGNLRQEVGTPTGNWLSSELRIKPTKGSEIANSFSTQAQNVKMNEKTLSPYPGKGGAHENRQPYLALGYCIATDGQFPSPPRP
jgi:microcystin-dependent protein